MSSKFSLSYTKYISYTIQKIYFQDTSPPLMETDTVDSMLDSPTTSRGIDMMDLDPNMMDEPYDSGFLQGSAPIPIRSAIRLSIRFALSIFLCEYLS